MDNKDIRVDQEEEDIHRLQDRYLLLVHELDEVLLALQLVLQLRGVHRRQRSLLGLDLRVRLHLLLFLNKLLIRDRDIYVIVDNPQSRKIVRKRALSNAHFRQKSDDGITSILVHL